MIILQLKNSRKYINCNSLINNKDQGQRGDLWKSTSKERQC